MRITRRETMFGAAALAALAPPGRTAEAANAPLFDPKPGPWRSFEITTRLEILKPEGATRAWIPLPSFEDARWMRPVSSRWQANAVATRKHTDPVYGAEMVAAEWEAGATAPSIRYVITAREVTV